MRASWAACHTAFGLRRALGRASSRNTGQDPGELGQRQHVTGKVQAPVPQRPLGHRADPAPGQAPRRPAHRVDQHELADPVGEPVGQGDGHPAPERVADDQRRPVDPDRAHEGVDPLGVAGEATSRPGAGGRCRRTRAGRAPRPGSPSPRAGAGAGGRSAPTGPSRGGTAPEAPRPPRRRRPPARPRWPVSRPGDRPVRVTWAAPSLVNGTGRPPSPVRTRLTADSRRPTLAPAAGQPARRASTAFRSISFRPPQMPCGSRICSA